MKKSPNSPTREFTGSLPASRDAGRGRIAPRRANVLAAVALAGLVAFQSAWAEPRFPWLTAPAACGEDFALCTFAELAPIPVSVYDALKRRDFEILRDIPRERVLLVSEERAGAVLEAMIAAGWGSMHFFAHPLFARDSRVLLFDREVLAFLDRTYMVPAIFPIRGKLREATAGVPAGTEFSMESFLIGGGRIVALYPHPVEVHRDDAPFDLFSGNYGFFAVNFADIVPEAPGRLRLDSFRGRNVPGDAFGDIRAPMQCALESLEFVHGQTDIRVDIHCWPWAPDWKIRHPLFAPKAPARLGGNSEEHAQRPVE